MGRILHSGLSTGGVAVGKAFFPGGSHLSAPHGADGAAATLDEAFNKERNRLEALAAESDIFAAHLEILEDPTLRESIEACIRRGMAPAAAVDEACSSICAMFKEIDDEYLRARVDDIRDICANLRRSLDPGAGRDPWEGLPDGAVIVSEELFPSDLAGLDFSRVRALVTCKGSLTGHVFIIARGKGVPAVTGIDISQIHPGDKLLVDGAKGEVIIEPSEAELDRTGALVSGLSGVCAIGQESRWNVRYSRPDGSRVAVLGNAANADEVSAAIEGGAEGIGVFRTEFMFMAAKDFPSEEVQFEWYSEAVRRCKGKPILFRTLDIGGDKALPYWPLEKEANPFLGVRGIRLSLRRPEILRAQLRAMVRASAFGPVKIMIPMVVSPSEVVAVRTILNEAVRDLDPDRAVPLGIMVETPAAALTARSLAEVSDFFSIGTNDLTQYILAADRMNDSVSDIYNPLHPAVLEAVRLTVEAAHEAGIPVGVCGEMAADPVAAKALANLGVDYLSI